MHALAMATMLYGGNLIGCLTYMSMCMLDDMPAIYT